MLKIGICSVKGIIKSDPFLEIRGIKFLCTFVKTKFIFGSFFQKNCAKHMARE